MILTHIIKRAAVGFLTVALLAMPALAATYQGIDIAHYDDVRDFSAIKTSGHGQFVYIKTSEGTGWRDPKRQAFTAGAKVAGIPFGYYHYFHSGTDAYGAAQADTFWSLIQNTGYAIVPAVDVEETDRNDAPVIQSSLRAFVNRFYALSGQKPAIYASTAFINKFIGGGFADCLLWQAHYGVSSPGAVSGWGNDYAVWQYDRQGTVSGIDNAADLDLAADNRIFVNAKATVAEINNAALSAASAGQPAPQESSDYYPVASLPQAANSRAGVDFYIRDRYGNRIGSHQIDAGDPIIILGVDYGRQLAEVLYPNYAAHAWYHGYIANDEAHLHNAGYNAWLNGSTGEPVYDAAGARIGTIYAREHATILGYAPDGRAHLLYGTSKGPESKDGYVWYPGK